MKKLRSVAGLGLFLLAWLLSGAVGTAGQVTSWASMSEIETAARKEGKLVIYVGGGHASPAAQQAIS